MAETFICQRQIQLRVVFPPEMAGQEDVVGPQVNFEETFIFEIFMLIQKVSVISQDVTVIPAQLGTELILLKRID
jgi:hypothetical protein